MAAEKVGQLPTNIDLVIYEGDDFHLVLGVAASGVPVDLTGYTAKAQIRSTTESDVVLAEFDCDINLSEVLLHLTSADATDIAAATVWDVQVTDADGEVTTLAYGRVTATQEVTRL